MVGHQRIRRSTMHSVWGLACFWILMGLPTARAQESSASHWGTGGKDAHTFVGAKACELCHGGHVNQQNRADEFVLLSECEVWKGVDKHYQAFEVLKRERSQTIGEKMRIADVTRDARCLACHAALPLDQLKPGPDALAAAEVVADEKVRITDGVGCESCHGPAGKTNDGKDGWLLAHASLERQGQSWRSRTAAEKFDVFGMWDIRDVATQTRICASCHIGNVSQGKIITHEMYAAGHPPLPPFELSSFVAQMPRHWRLPGEKSPKAIADYERDAKVALNKGGFDISRQVAIATLVTLSESLKLNADLMSKELQPAAAVIPKPAFPELATYACYHCHHELQSPAWRQTRKLRTVPGRPLFHEWPFALAKAVVSLAGDGPAGQYLELEDKLFQDLGRQAFGDETSLPNSSRALSEFLDATAASLSDRPFTRADAEALFHQLCEIGSTETLDYDSARQLVWATERIHADLRSGAAKGGPDRVVRSIEPLIRSPGWLTETPRDPLEEALKALEVQGTTGLLVLNLRLGNPAQAIVNQQPRPVVEVDLTTILPPIDVYDPAKLKAAFEVIRSAGQSSAVVLPPRP